MQDANDQSVADLYVAGVLCVLHIKPFFLPVDIHPNQCFVPILQHIMWIDEFWDFHIPNIHGRKEKEYGCTDHDLQL